MPENKLNPVNSDMAITTFLRMHGGTLTKWAGLEISHQNSRVDTLASAMGRKRTTSPFYQKRLSFVYQL